MQQNDRMCLLGFITEVSFALDDIALYLDLHPGCQRAMEDYHKYHEMRDQAVKEYNDKFGPLNKHQDRTEGYFKWIETPWPWEREANC